MSKSEKTNPKNAPKSKDADTAKTKGGNGSEQSLQQTNGTSQKPTVSHMLGELTWLLTQSATHKHFTLSDLEWMIMPPLVLEQYRVFRGEKTPIGYATWAYLSEEAEAKLMAGQHKLRPDEWKSDDRLWLVDLVAPFASADNKHVERMLTDLMNTALKGKKFKLHKTDPQTAKRDVVELGERM